MTYAEVWVSASEAAGCPDSVRVLRSVVVDASHWVGAEIAVALVAVAAVHVEGLVLVHEDPGVLVAVVFAAVVAGA